MKSDKLNKKQLEIPIKESENVWIYAANKANNDSDIDLLGINVDLIEIPIPEDSILHIERTMDLYEK